MDGGVAHRDEVETVFFFRLCLLFQLSYLMGDPGGARIKGERPPG